MSIGPSNLIGSLAATPLPTQAAQSDKTLRETGDRDRQAESTRRAESAAGIGQTEEDSEAQDRDADGRQLLKRPAVAHGAHDSQPQSAQIAAPGETGGEIDLMA